MVILVAVGSPVACAIRGAGWPSAMSACMRRMVPCAGVSPVSPFGWVMFSILVWRMASRIRRWVWVYWLVRSRAIWLCATPDARAIAAWVASFAMRVGAGLRAGSGWTYRGLPWV